MKFVLHSCVLLFLFSYSTQSSHVNLSVRFQSSLPLDSRHYIVQLMNQSLSLALATRRGVTTTQTCGSSSSSSNATPIACTDHLCSVFAMDVLQRSLRPGENCDQGPMCSYSFLNQTGQAVNNGTVSKVDLAVLPAFVFGCGRNTTGPPLYFGDGGVDGVLGLGRANLSFLSQTNNTRFSYCLPSGSNSTGHLTLGENNNTRDSLLSFTPFAAPHNGAQYFVDIVAITVGGTQLPIDFQSIEGTVIETMLEITRIPSDAYGQMRDEFKRKMGTNYPAAAAFSIFDTCYDTTNQSSITVPPVSFTFKNNVTVDLDVSGILYVVNSTLSCFAFANSSNSPNFTSPNFVIFASAQQRTLEMVFDVANNKLGFGQNGCA